MAEGPATVIVIDDDPSVREALGNLLRSVDLQTHLHDSVAKFLKAGRPDGPTCLVLGRAHARNPKTKPQSVRTVFPVGLRARSLSLGVNIDAVLDAATDAATK